MAGLCGSIPTREFHNGDRIRISLEPNIDGYLYVFHTGRRRARRK
jgi:hypothetical protein